MYVFHLLCVVSLCRDSRRLFNNMPSLRNWVVSTATPRIAREDTFESEPAAFEETVFLYGFDAVVGTGGRIAAAVAYEGRQRHLINADEQDQELSRQLGDAFHGW